MNFVFAGQCAAQWRNQGSHSHSEKGVIEVDQENFEIPLLNLYQTQI